MGKPLGKGIVKKFSGVDLDEVADGLEEATDVTVDELANLGERVLDRFSEEQKVVFAFKKALWSILLKLRWMKKHQVTRHYLCVICG